jgi:hypothetical protein
MNLAFSMLSNYGRSLYYFLGNRRSFERQATDGPVRLGYYDRSGSSVMLACEGVDVSATGMGVRCPEAIPVNTGVFLCAAKTEEFSVARVCHCEEQGDSFRIGLALSIVGQSQKPVLLSRGLMPRPAN